MQMSQTHPVKFQFTLSGVILNVTPTRFDSPEALSPSYKTLRQLNADATTRNNFQVINLRDSRIPQNRIATQARAIQIHLQLRGAARAGIDVVFGDVTLPRRQRRHRVVEIQDALERVMVVVFIGLTVDMTAEAASNGFFLAVADNLQSRMKAQ